MTGIEKRKKKKEIKRRKFRMKKLDLMTLEPQTYCQFFQDMNSLEHKKLMK